MNEALAGRPAGMAVTTHLCRGNFRSSWVASGSYDFVAEALFNEPRGRWLLPGVGRRALGRLRAAALPAEGKGRGARARDDEARRARAEGRAERRIDEAATFVDQLCLSPQCAALLDGRGQRAHRRAAGGQAPPRGRSGRRSLGRLRTVRDATFDVFRRRGLTTMFAEPRVDGGPVPRRPPDDIRFVLGLHETAVVGLARGSRSAVAGRLSSFCTRRPGSARESAPCDRPRNRAPLVVVVGQQDRRHLAYEPFLAGKLAGLGGEYPVSVDQPARHRTSRPRSSVRFMLPRRDAVPRS